MSVADGALHERSAATMPIPHRVGVHCGSSAIRDMIEFHGTTLSEAFCFGLGSGLGITYLELPGTPIPFMVHVRSLGFEERVFECFEPRQSWQQFESRDAADEALARRLDCGKPALLLTDIFHLPYYGSKTHFPGHAIVAWKRDTARNEVFVTDTEREELLRVPTENLSKARFSVLAPFLHPGNMYSPDGMTPRGNLVDDAISAIRTNAQMLDTDHGAAGLGALSLWREKLTDWAAHPEWRWICRFAYQVIEKRGTGGGGFRGMYSRFLEEVAARHPFAGVLVKPMQECAQEWTALSRSLKAASEADALPLADIRERLLSVEVTERRYVELATKL